MTEEKSVPPTRLKTNLAARITQTIDAVTALGLRVVVALETLLGPVLNAIGTLVTITFSIPVLGLLLFRLATAFHYSISGLFLIPESVLDLCGILPEKRLRLRVIIQRDERGQPICQAVDVLPQLQQAIDIFHQQANVRILPIGPFVFPLKSVETASDKYIVICPSPSTGPHLDCRSSRWRLRGRIWFNAKACRYSFWANWRRMLGYGAPICVFAVRSIETTFPVEGGYCVGLAGRGLFDFVLVDFASHVGVSKQSDRMAHELGHACLLAHSPAHDNLMNVASRTDGSIPVLTSEQIFLIRFSPHVTYF